MVSLLKLARITEEGVRFLSPHDGSPMYGFVWPPLDSRSSKADPVAPQAAHT